MMKGKAFIPLAVGLVVGVFAIKYTMNIVDKAKGSTVSTDVVEVVVARQDIASTDAIRPEVLAVIKTPRTPLLPADCYSKIEELVDRVALKSIPQGSPILPSMIAPPGTPSGLLVRVKEGYRAVAVRIDESTGVGYLVKPNDWVDVLAVMEQDKFGRRETVSRVVLERVQVGAVGQVLNESRETDKRTESSRAQTVTLIVKVDDVPKLHLAQTQGKITLAMRGTEDTELHGAAASDVDLEEAKAARPTPLSGGVGAFFSAWAKAASQLRPAPAVEEVDESMPTSVAVINSSASARGEGVVEHLTFRSDDSMELVGRNDGGFPAARRPGAGRVVRQPSAPDLRGPQEPEKGTAQPVPSEVTE